MNPLDQHLEEIQCLCVAHKVQRLEAFGSVLHHLDDDSDIDLAVVFETGYANGAFAQYFDFKEALESLLQRPVDLVCYNAIRNQVFREEIDATKLPLYAA
ncbi:nucleotidyltransferase family protein [Cerasicoccus frondis]|uniref:nucleotidyltransferase family protein n=1 Tax=Cerasicoccus frondis TaxID=490090 RepID=UPI0028527748|nr:nucleotidyltransferase domain-containing protein [Cerasicoccus frondis]